LLLTKADFYFPDHRLVIFCDSAKHHRSKKAKQKDEAITDKLKNLGFNTLRIPGPMIVNDFNNALNLVVEKLNS
jgi:very-short-patch-repair endonuclease